MTSTLKTYEPKDWLKLFEEHWIEITRKDEPKEILRAFLDLKKAQNAVRAEMRRRKMTTIGPIYRIR